MFSRLHIFLLRVVLRIDRQDDYGCLGSRIESVCHKNISETASRLDPRMETVTPRCMASRFSTWFVRDGLAWARLVSQ